MLWKLKKDAVVTNVSRCLSSGVSLLSSPSVPSSLHFLFISSSPSDLSAVGRYRKHRNLRLLRLSLCSAARRPHFACAGAFHLRKFECSCSSHSRTTIGNPYLRTEEELCRLPCFKKWGREIPLQRCSGRELSSYRWKTEHCWLFWPRGKTENV